MLLKCNLVTGLCYSSPLLFSGVDSYGLHASLILLPPIPGEAIEAIAVTWTTFLNRLLMSPLLIFSYLCCLIEVLQKK